MTTPLRFKYVEETFQNYERTKANYPRLSQTALDAITGVVKTIDVQHVYDDLNPAMQHLKQIIPPVPKSDEDGVPSEMPVVTHDSMLARMGGVMLLCSLIENRLRSMYRQRMAFINGTRTLTAAEEAEIYEDLPNNPENVRILKRDVIEVSRICTFLLMSHDIDLHTYNLLTQFMQIRNALVHDAMFRSARFTDDVLRFLQRIYTHMQNMRGKMDKRVKAERQLYADDGQRDTRVATQLDGITFGTRVTREEVYRRLAGSIRLKTPMANRRFMYVVVPFTATKTFRIKLDPQVKLLESWDDPATPWLAPTPVFREVDTHHNLEFCGYGTVYDLEYDKKVFKALSVSL
jgi:hypothetical protein